MKNYIYQVRYFEKGAYNSKEYTSVESATNVFAKLSSDETITYLKLERVVLVKEIKMLKGRYKVCK